jgi:hypothetical protein
MRRVGYGFSAVAEMPVRARCSLGRLMAPAATALEDKTPSSTNSPHQCGVNLASPSFSALMALTDRWPADLDFNDIVSYRTVHAGLVFN